MLSILFLAVLIVASASSHDGKCPVHDGHAASDHYTANGERVIVVEENYPPTKSAVVTGQKTVVEKVEEIAPVKSQQVEVKTVVQPAPIPVFPSVKTIPVATKTFGQKTLVQKVEEQVIKPAPIVEKVIERVEQFPPVKTIPVDVKTFVTGQKFVTKEVDVPVEPKFDVQKIVKVVHISKESVLPPASPEATFLGLAAGADALFGGSTIDTSFSCHGKKYGYYADIKNQCKIYHICKEVALADGTTWTQRSSFTCAEGTVFDQQKHSCIGFADAMDCSQSEAFYDHTAKVFATPAITEKKLLIKEAAPIEAPVKSCCVYPQCSYVFPCTV